MAENDQGALEQDGGDRPDFLLDKYASVEDQARAYAEADKLMTRPQQEMRAEREARAAAEAQAWQYQQALEQQQQAQQQQQWDPQSDAQLVLEAQAWEEGDTMRALQLRDQRFAQFMLAGQQMQQQQYPQQPTVSEDVVNNLTVGYVEQEVARRLGADYEDLRADLREMMEARPHAFRDPKVDPAGTVEDLLWAADRIRSEKQLADRNAQVNTQQQQAQQMKRLSQSAAGGGRVAGTPDFRQEWMEQVRAMQKSGPGSLTGS